MKLRTTLLAACVAASQVPAALAFDLPTLPVRPIGVGLVRGVLHRLGRFKRMRRQIDMVFRLEVGDTPYEIPLDAEGAERAEELLTAVFPGTERDGSPSFTDTGTWQLLDSLGDEGFQDEFERVASFSNGQRFFITVIVDDAPTTLQPGAELNVPGGTYEVQEGDTFASIAEAHGLDQRDLLDLNDRRFRIGAAAHYNSDGTRDVRFGESRILRDGTLESFHGTLLHEVGHVADTSRCALEYGPDGSHYFHEIMTPATAFTEGWANYVGAHVPGRYERNVRTPPDLQIEGPTAGGYHLIEPEDLTANDHFSNEANVGRILLAMEETLPGGRTAVEQAFQDSNGEDCRSVALLIEAYVKRHPDSADGIRAILDEVTGERLDDRGFERILKGDLPRGLDSDDLPRSRNYKPGGEPSLWRRILDALFRRKGKAAAARPTEPEAGPVGFLGMTD